MSTSLVKSIWTIRALTAIDLLIQSAGLLIRAAYIPPRYVSYPLYQIIIACIMVTTSAIGFLITVFAFDKPIALRIFGSFMAGNICANILALLIIVVSLIYHGLWYRMCDNPKVCPIMIDTGAVMLACFVGTQLLWSIFGQSTLALKIKRLASISQGSIHETTEQGVAKESDAAGLMSHESPTLRTPLPIIGTTAQEKSEDEQATSKKLEPVIIENYESSAGLVI